MHTSVLNVGQELHALAIGTHFGCPLCPKVKPTSLKRIKSHFEGHVNIALHFGDKIICRCNLPCRSIAHYHCPYCCKTLLSKIYMERHVKRCIRTTSNEVTPTWIPQLPVSNPERPPSLQTLLPVSTLGWPPLHDHDYSLLAEQPPTEVVPNSDCVPSPQLVSIPERSASLPESSPERPPLYDYDYSALASASSDSDKVDSVETSETSASASCVKKLKMAKCPHCELILYQKNLNVHIQRKHTHKKDTTASFHLKSVCVDQVNGIFAVCKVSSHGFSTPVHVQCKTQGEQQQTMCELEECQQFHLLAQCSGFTHCLCEHITSLDYSSDTADNVD